MVKRQTSRWSSLAVVLAVGLYTLALVFMARHVFAAPPSTAAAPAAPATGFVAPAEKIEPPYTNEKCLEKCHGLPEYYASAADGSLRRLTVDAQEFIFSTHGQKGVQCIDCHQGADPNAHPRAGYPDVDCRACHSKTPPADVFPVDALAKLAERGIQPPPEESRNAEGWNQTQHGKAWAQGTRGAPFCADCHTAHAIRKSADPRSTVHRANLPTTCGGCHVDQVACGDVGGVLARLRVSAHGKGDLSEVHAVSQCLSCHQGQGAHGEETLTGQACPSCHRVPEAGEKGTTRLASFHIKPLSEEQPVARALRWLYRVGVWGTVAGVGLLATVLGFATLYRKQEEDEG